MIKTMAARKRDRENYTISAVIMGVVSLMFLPAFGAAVYGLFSTGNGQLVPVAMLMGLIAFSAVGLTLHSAHRAMHA